MTGGDDLPISPAAVAHGVPPDRDVGLVSLMIGVVRLPVGAA